MVRVQSCRSSPPENEDRHLLVPKITDFTGGESEPSWGQPAKERRPPGFGGAGSRIYAGTTSRHTPFGSGPPRGGRIGQPGHPLPGTARPARRRQPHHPAQEEEDRSQGLCTGCPLSDACTDYAIANDYRDGIWGGLTVDERDQLTRERATAIADEN
ncbi:hypothetical protein DC008_35010 [Streptomyces nigra]|nr:hypothetical protein DC008_35010 [Streptomyces nigra]